jgi:phenylalanyl-tRNA synthetase beta chain
VHALPDGGSLFEMDITTNRVDAMNHYGIAREAATLYGVPLLSLEDRRVLNTEGDALAASLPSEACEVPAPGSKGDAYPVRIDAPELCGRFTAQVVRGVTVKPSEGIVAERFAQIGQKPISNAVDVTNYNWLSMGHPTHVFDLDTIEGSIIVRRAHAGEKIKLLDGSEKTLVTDDVVIADEKKALSLAGVMGGWDSRVTDDTKNILVEAAWFDPATIRATSRRHGLHTDASHRYERGADLGACALANRLVTRGVIAACGGEAIGAMADIVIEAQELRTTRRPHVALAVEQVQRILGTTIEESTAGHLVPADVIEQYLQSLGCHLRPVADAGTYEVTLPSWRLDLEREIDLIEEIARVYGYNRFADTLPSFSGGVIVLPHAAKEEVVRTTLRSLGWTEAISSTFTSETDSTLFTTESAVPMGNPLNSEASNLRPSLLPGMAGMLQLNSTRDVASVRLFEYGTIFVGTTAQVTEHPSLTLGAYGNTAATRTIDAADALFFEVKGAVEELLSRFVASAPAFTANNLPKWIAAGRGAVITLEGKPIGYFGELTAEERERRKLKGNVVLAELNIPALFAFDLKQPAAKEPSRYQAVERDFSVLFADNITWAAVSQAIASLNIAEMISLQPIEIFRDAKGKAVPRGEYSLLLRTVFQSPERTLREEEIAGWQEAIVAEFTKLGGKHRAA